AAARVEQRVEADADRAQVAADDLRILAQVQGGDSYAGPGLLARHLVEIGHLGAAGRTPRRPEVDEHRLPPQIRQVDAAAGDRAECKVRRDLANLRTGSELAVELDRLAAACRVGVQDRPPLNK